MHEYIEIQFRRNDKRFRLDRQVENGFEFDEPDPETRRISLGLAPRDAVTRYRMDHIRQIQGWSAGEFKLKVAVEDGSLVIRGHDRYSLPEGFYDVTVSVDGAKAKMRTGRVRVPHDDHAQTDCELSFDDRTIEVDLASSDPMIASVLAASQLDGRSGLDWVMDTGIRPTRRACVLNLLASLRVFPTLSAPLLSDIDRLFVSLDDRCYARTLPSLFTRVSDLANHHDKVYAEGRPHAAVHRLLLPAIGAFDSAAIGLFVDDGLASFRAEGSPSVQLVVATPTTSYPFNFAELDLDLGNPLQDLVGLTIHIGELLDGKRTNHLDLRRKLAAGKAKEFLYYKVVNPS
ncbi:MAG TPA: hypothetical protein VFO19_13425 [Vicinamibacterales bacterium]|nr:hypothetical protein [Vicinamibacterales bacterium]